MADIFQEVDEDLRRERAQRFWAANGRYVIAAAVLVILAASGWQFYQRQMEQQAEAAGSRFEQALALSRGGKTNDAAGAFKALSADGPAGYALLARFRLAAETGAVDAASGAKQFDALAADGSVGTLLQGLARLRAAALLVDSAPYDAMKARLDDLSAPSSPWRHSARELLGLSAWRAKNWTEAARWYEALIEDADVPASIRERAEAMQQLISAEMPARAAS
jgi:hypothetical protein